MTTTAKTSPTFDQIIQAKAAHIGKLSVRATTAAGSGHPTTSLSLAHIIAVLMYHTMRWDPAQPAHKGSDRLVLSEGHAVPIVYAACADIGVTIYPDGRAKTMDEKDLMTLRDIHSPIDGHPNPQVGFPFFDAATGSLGQGLSVAAGLAAAARVDNIKKSIYCIIGDGESREGQIWEAMDFIAEHELTSVVAIFNCNLLGQSDWVSPAQSSGRLQKKAEAFGWKTIVIDGHSPEEIRNALNLQQEAKVAGKPLCIIARTVKGWGAPSIEGLGHHGTPVPEKDLQTVLDEIDQAARELGADQASPDGNYNTLRIRPPVAVPEHPAATRPATLQEMAVKEKQADNLNKKKKLAPRRGWGLALEALGLSNPNIVALDADVQNSTYSEYFAKAVPNRFFECKIAEQNMVSVAAGMAAAGKVPFASTFGKFLVRGFDQLEMAIISGANIKFVGTHIGVTLAADGPSQMAIADVAFCRALAHAKNHRGESALTILTPSDAVSAYSMVLGMANHGSACYLRAFRADMPILYQETDTFPFGGFKVVHKPAGGNKKLVIAACGYLVHTCTAAAKKLEAQGIAATVVDAYSLPLDAEPLLKLAAENGGLIVTAEDNYVGGLGSELAEAAALHAAVKVHALAVHRIPKSGKTPEDVLEYVGLAENDIVQSITKVIG